MPQYTHTNFFVSVRSRHKIVTVVFKTTGSMKYTFLNATEIEGQTRAPETGPSVLYGSS